MLLLHIYYQYLSLRQNIYVSTNSHTLRKLNLLVKIILSKYLARLNIDIEITYQKILFVISYN